MTFGNGLVHSGRLGVHAGSAAGAQTRTADPSGATTLLLLFHHLLLDHSLDDAAGHVDGILGVGREGDDALRAARGHLELLLDLHLAPAPALHGQDGLSAPADDEPHDAIRDADLLLDEGGGSRRRTVVPGRAAAAGEAQEGGDGLGGVAGAGRSASSGAGSVLAVHTGGGHGTLESAELTSLE